MRDQLEDIHQHNDANAGRPQGGAWIERPKRFYKDVGVAAVEGGFTVTLDGRATRTPGAKVPVVVPAAGIASAMAAEWAGQGDLIDAEVMPTVRLINSALESGEAMVPAFREEVVKFASSDLMLYRADSPHELVARQDEIWDDALVRIARHFGVSFQPTVGIIFQEQPKSTLAKLAEALDGQGLLVMTALVSITGLTGSGLLAIGLWHQLLSPDEVWLAGHVDEDHQISLWGGDEEAEIRRAKRRIEFDAAVNVLENLRT